MSQSQHSSGDFLADRRGGYAEALASELEYAEAAEVMAQALERVPGWAAGWNNLGRYREEAGDRSGAIEAWRKSAALDTAGTYGAVLKLVAYGEIAEAGATAYVETLFDDYAERFETSLVDRLGYRAPGALARLLAGTGRAPGGRALDLGCGTGLMGVELRPLVGRLEGVDVSEAMLAEARRKGIYDRLVKADLLVFLGEAGPAELVTATDVLNYTGPLPPVLAAVWQVLPPGGLFAFSLETHAGPEAVLLRTTLRYAHNADAALAACREAGFAVVAAPSEALRHDRGEPVMGLLVVLERP
jgi:predicted TPR repeat methyltransferase